MDRPVPGSGRWLYGSRWLPLSSPGCGKVKVLKLIVVMEGFLLSVQRLAAAVHLGASRAGGAAGAQLSLQCGGILQGDLPDDGLFFGPDVSLGAGWPLPPAPGWLRSRLCFLGHHAPPPLLPVPCARSPAPGGAAAASGCRRHTAVGRFQRPAPPGLLSSRFIPGHPFGPWPPAWPASRINGRRVSSSMAVHSQPVYCTVCPFLVIFTVNYSLYKKSAGFSPFYLLQLQNMRYRAGQKG